MQGHSKYTTDIAINYNNIKGQNPNSIQVTGFVSLPKL